MTYRNLDCSNQACTAWATEGRSKVPIAIAHLSEMHALLLPEILPDQILDQCAISTALPMLAPVGKFLLLKRLEAPRSSHPFSSAKHTTQLPAVQTAWNSDVAELSFSSRCWLTVAAEGASQYSVLANSLQMGPLLAPASLTTAKRLNVLLDLGPLVRRTSLTRVLCVLLAAMGPDRAAGPCNCEGVQSYKMAQTGSPVDQGYAQKPVG